MFCVNLVRIELQFEGIRMAKTEACKMQSIAIYNDKVADTNLATRFCGEGAPDRFTSKGDTLILKISSNFPGNAPPKVYAAQYEIMYRKVLKLVFFIVLLFN